MSDVAKLRAAIAHYRERIARDEATGYEATYLAEADLIVSAAEKHLATLPKTKPMWFVIWRQSGEWKLGAYLSGQDAAYDAQTCANRFGYEVIATVGPYEVPDDLP